MNTETSSKPVVVLNYESQIKSQIQNKISSRCEYRIKSGLVNVCGISDKRIFTLSSGEFLDSHKEKWNCSFEGEANIDILERNGYSTKIMKIKGFARIEKGECVKISKEIQCY